MNSIGDISAFPGFESTSGYGSSKKNASGEWENYVPGMTYRQWLIGKALQGIVAGYCARPINEAIPRAAILAQHAIEAADSVITELNKELCKSNLPFIAS